MPLIIFVFIYFILFFIGALALVVVLSDGGVSFGFTLIQFFSCWDVEGIIWHFVVLWMQNLLCVVYLLRKRFLIHNLVYNGAQMFTEVFAQLIHKRWKVRDGMIIFSGFTLTLV